MIRILLSFDSCKLLNFSTVNISQFISLPSLFLATTYSLSSESFKLLTKLVPCYFLSQTSICLLFYWVWCLEKRVFLLRSVDVGFLCDDLITFDIDFILDISSLRVFPNRTGSRFHRASVSRNRLHWTHMIKFIIGKFFLRCFLLI